MSTVMQRAVSKPSSTISWAFLAGLGAAGVWEMVDTFTEVEPTAGLISVSTALASGVVGKLVKERVLK